MRLSSPSLTAALHRGCARRAATSSTTAWPAPTDVLRGRRRRPRRRRADHRVAQPEAVQRLQAGAARGVSAERRVRHQGDEGDDPRRHAAAAGGAAAAAIEPRRHDGSLHRPRHVVHRPVGHQAVQRRARRRQRRRRPGRAAAVRSAAVPDDATVLRGRWHVPEPRGQPAHRGEPPRHHRAGDRQKRRRRHRLGRRRRSLLLPRRHRRVHRRRLRHGAAGRGVPDEKPGLDDHLRRARQLRGQGHRRAVTAAGR